MNANKFAELVNLHGDKLVYVEGSKFVFTIGDVEVDDKLVELMKRAEHLINCGGEVNIYVGYGDDLPNAVSVRDLSNFGVDGLEEWVIENIGENCYSDED